MITLLVILKKPFKMNIIPIFIIFLAFAGFLLAFYIRHKKATGEKMICPIGAECDAVIKSSYSTFWGVSVEIFGLIYYCLVALSYAAFLVFPALVLPITIFMVLGMTIVALLFSSYLVFIQAFNLKQWCSWCLVSAGICSLIFFLALSSTEISLSFVLNHYQTFILMLHVMGMALGVGGATIADVFFIRFLKNFRISETEAEVLRTITQVIWFALAIIVLSGVGLYLPEAATLNQSPKFLAKIAVVLVVIVNGAFLNLLISPRLVQISFGGRHFHEVGELHNLRKIAFALGAVSIVSWYSAFILGMLPILSWSLASILLIYFMALVVAVVLSQVLEYYFDIELP